MFNEVKKLFRDKIDISLYVPLYKKLEIDMMYAINEQERMILLYGEAGSGKSFLLNRVYNLLKEKETDDQIYFIHNPMEEEKLDEVLNIKIEQHIILFIDEAQTLSVEKLEKLRIIADNKNYTIILATHEKEAKEIFAKKHFKNRIDYILHTLPCSYDEMTFFISSKLSQNGFDNILQMFSKKNYKLIYKFTKGNLREINQLLYRTFDIMQYFYEKEPAKINKQKLDNKYIEMANIFIKEVHA
jgi:type II secretory pathway predicted ATPase ExeA